VSKAKIKKKHFDQRPILLIVIIFNEINLESFNDGQTLRKFDNDEETQIFCN
jgi:hypothetical protein